MAKVILTLKLMPENPDVDLTPEEYLEFIKPLSYEDLVLETGTDEEYTLDDYMENWK